MSTLTTYIPDPELGGCIVSFGIVEVAEGFTARFLLPPLGLSGLIIQHQSSTGHAIALLNGANILVHKAIAIGQLTSTLTASYTGKIKILFVFFHPLGMHQLFSIAMQQLSNSSINLFDLMGETKANLLLDRLKETDDNTSLIAILNDFFKDQEPILAERTEISRVLDFIHLHHGNISMSEIETHCFAHRKSIERHFQIQIGLCPKTYACIYRFKCLMNYLRQNPGTNWLKLSHLTGYYDQPHMLRYFKAYLNVSPNQLVKLNIDFVNHLLSRS